jgi:hypothetical protein
MTQSNKTQYVVTAGMISGGHRKGAVLTAEQVGDGVDHLLATRSIREATESERGLPFVTIRDEPAAARSYEQELADKERMLADRDARILELTKQLRDAAADKAVGTDETRSASLSHQIATRDSHIADLEAKAAFVQGAPTAPPPEGAKKADAKDAKK